MKHIMEQFKKNMQKKHLTKQSVGAFIVHYLKNQVNYPNQTTGKIQGDIVVLKCAPQEDKTTLFHKRTHLRDEINTKLEASWYDLRISALRIQ